MATTCPDCGAEGVPGSRFCARCGRSLAVTCPSCGTEAAADARFCAQCGAAIDPSVEIPETRAERRMVTVLFADLVGFTTYAENRDPEEVRDMLSRFFVRSREVIERFRGSVEKFIGDAVMACWGAVEAREDDAERAVRAALELVDEVAGLGSEIGVPELAARAGVLTGEAAVGEGGNGEGIIVGDLVNTASRLQSIAEPGTVLVGESTRSLVASAVEFVPRGDEVVRGRRQPISTYQALRVVAQRGGRGRSDAIEPPFVGRHEELRLLKDQMHATGREQRARLISIYGDPGIGKSRIAWELKKYIDGIAEGVFWHQGRSPAYGDGIAYWALGEMVRGRAGIGSLAEDRAKSRMKLRTVVAEHVPLEEERRWIEPRLATLVGLEDMPEGDRSELFAAIRTFFHRITEQGTTVLVFEDLHWADDGVLDFITDLIDRSTRHPIMVLTLSRPDLLDRHPGWGAGRRNHVSLHLAPLPPPEVRRMVDAMIPGIPDGPAGQIVDRAAGVPLYAVEFARMLLASGDLRRDDGTVTIRGDLSQLSIPNSLSAVIGSRLDRLDPQQRALIQDAAVLGQVFTAQGLGAVRGDDGATTQDLLRDLVRSELVEYDDDPRSSSRGSYRFVQGLIRDVAYGRLSLADRHVRHRRVAEYFAGLDEPELAGIVASHYLAAQETAPPGSEDLLEKGRAALLEAAHRASSLKAGAEALHLYKEALNLSQTPSQRAHILVKACRAAGAAGEVEEGIALGRQALDLMEEIEDAEGRLEAIAAIGYIYNSFYRSDEAAELLVPACSEIDEFDSRSKVRLGLETARALMLTQEPLKALDVAERVLPQAEALAPVAWVIDGIVTKGTILAYLGRHLECEAVLSGAIAMADAHDVKVPTLRALNNLSVIQAAVDPMASADTAEEAWERAHRFGSTSFLERATADRADRLVGFGRYQEVLEALDGVEVEHLPPLLQLTTQATRLRVDAHRDPDSKAAAELHELVASAPPMGDPQANESLSWINNLGYSMQGDWDGAFQSSLGIPYAWGAEATLLAAVRSGDPERLERALARVEELAPASGRLGQALRQIADGAIRQTATGEDAAETMNAGLQLLSEVSLPTPMAAWQTAVAGLLGRDHPLATELGRAALDWLTEIGAHGLLALWADGLPAEAAARHVGTV